MDFPNDFSDPAMADPIVQSVVQSFADLCFSVHLAGGFADHRLVKR
jgi:hypothetical protein